MSESPRLFIALAELTDRRPIEPSEFAEFQRRARRGLIVATGAIVGIVALYLLIGLAVALASLRLEVIGLAVFLITIVGLAAVVLFVRDGIATYRRYRSIAPDAELMLFRVEPTDIPQFTVVSPGNLVIQVRGEWLKMPLIVQPTEVAPASDRTQEVADWLLTQEGDTATRMLEPAERQELERQLRHRRFNMRWYDWFYLAWAIFAIIGIISGPARSETFTFIRAALVLWVGWSVLQKLIYVHRVRREIRQTLSVGMVKLALYRMSPDAEPIVLESLMPEGIPWSMDGRPVPWRSL